MCENAPDHIKRWLEELNLPIGLLQLMQWDWPQTDCFIVHIRVLSSESIYSDETTSALVAHKFLQVGSAPNGDWFVIDFSTEACVPGFITHEEWSPTTVPAEDARPFFEPIAKSLESFLYRAVEDKYLPTDFYAARDFNAFLRREQSGGG